MKTKHKEIPYFNGKNLDTYFRKLLRKGFKRMDNGSTLKLILADNGLKRVLEIEKSAIELREIKPKVDLSAQFEVLE